MTSSGNESGLSYKVNSEQSVPGTKKTVPLCVDWNLPRHSQRSSLLHDANKNKIKSSLKIFIINRI